MRNSILSWLFLGCAFSTAAAAATAANSPQKPLHLLSAGTQLVAHQSILIPANSSQIMLSNSASPGSVCRLRLKEAKPFDRVLPENRALIVSGTSRAGFSTSRRIAMSTYVQLNSRSMDDFVCVSDHGSHEMTMGEFERILAADFSIKLPEQAPTIID